MANRGTFWISGSCSCGCRLEEQTRPPPEDGAGGFLRQERMGCLSGMGGGDRYRLIGNQVVDVVAALPPADGQAAAEIGDEHANQGVHHEIMRDGEVAGVVCGEHDLVLSHDCQAPFPRHPDGKTQTQNSPKQTAEVMYQPYRSATRNRTNRPTYRTVSLPYSRYGQS